VALFSGSLHLGPTIDLTTARRCNAALGAGIGENEKVHDLVPHGEDDSLRLREGSSVLDVGAISLCYKVAGSGDRPLLLIHGLGAQLIGWPPELPQGLLAEGFTVVSFDNRDAGLSTHLRHLGLPDLVRGRREGGSAPYLLADLADDAAGLLERLGVARAHVVGVSMGGMIAQELAIRHPGRVLSLCSIMSTTGDPTVGRATRAASAVLLRHAPASRDEAIEQTVADAHIISSPGYPFDEERARARAAAAYDRCHDPAGVARQLAAIISSPDRTRLLQQLDIPALVIHGTADPLVAVSGGRATAAAIPEAELLEIAGMGHDLPPELIPQIVHAITALAVRAEATDRDDRR